MAKEIRLSVDGMTCSGCEKNLTFALSSLAGVEQAKADYRAKTVEVAFDPSLTSEAEVRRAIEEIGYTSTTARGARSARLRGKPGLQSARPGR